MSYEQSQLKPYLTMSPDLIPINVWNKLVKGKSRGKTPVHNDWTVREYKQAEPTYQSWIDKGYNIGYRIPANEIIVDMDPRNYEGENCEQLIADLFGYFDWDELITELPTVRTGGGGYHVYCLLPDGVDCKLLKETLEEFPGVEFKRKGRQVLCAGSKHPSGNIYKWINHTSRRAELPSDVVEAIQREWDGTVKGDYSSGQGSLTGSQLEDMILDKLDPEDYSTNDSWFPILCAAHHATDGDGVEEFVEWSMQDSFYDDDENTIRSRWESLSGKANSITIGTLIQQLDNTGEDSSGVKAVLAFSNQPELDEIDDEDSEEAVLMQEAREVVAEIDIDDMYDTPHGEAGVEGAAIEAANELSVHSDQDEVMKCLRLIKAANNFEAIKAQEILVGNKILKQASMNKILKDLDAKIADDLALMLSQKTLEKTFNSGKHLTCPPNGLLYVFNKTHWRELSDEFLAKLIQNVLHQLKLKMKIESNELSLINQAVKLSRIQVATLTDRLHSTELPASVVNCKNGELWLNRDGSHVLKKHSYRSYLNSCLNVEYDPSADCPLFMETITDIFRDFPDTADMVSHLAELFGYMIQPYKNIASWFLFRGPGGDGKSTLLKILGGILNDAQVMTTVKLLASASGSGDNHSMTPIVGALNVVIEELPANYLLRDEGVKLFSENTKMSCNPKGAAQFPFMYAGGLIMCSNGFPATRDLSHGMVRRANIFPFNRQYTKEKDDGSHSADINRAADILQNPKEMSGILNFMLEGLQRLRDRGRFNPPQSCKDAKEEWLGAANNVVRFTKEKFTRTNNFTDCLGDLNVVYGEIYYMWCDDNGIDEKMRKGKSHFMKDMESLGFVIKAGKGNVRKIYGGVPLELETTADFKEEEFEDF